MLKRTALVIMFLAALLVGGARAARPASADDGAAAYREAMAGLIDATDAWTGEAFAEFYAVSQDPARACSDEYAQVVRRGRWLAADLRGSAMAAPTALVDANLGAADGFARMVEGVTLAGSSCDGAALEKGRSLATEGLTQYATQIRKIANFVNGFGGRGGGIVLPPPGIND